MKSGGSNSLWEIFTAFQMVGLYSFDVDKYRGINVKVRFTLGIIGCTLLTVLTPTILTAQTLPYGTARQPQTCSSRVEPKKGAPSVEQAKMYFLCDQESQFGTPGQGGFSSFIRLISDLTLQIAPKSRPANVTDLEYNTNQRGEHLSINMDKPVYDIRGSYTNHTCYEIRGRSHLPGKNCNVEQYTSAGICFQNTFGDWHCRMKGSTKKVGDNLPPPEK
ncbi:hypothetical protein [Brasilonema bromeliae]|uniref:Uncharacterized protein n=1 Tax=Brasilonema bromeliae SPC951 TaxID=385972 RepID=A0ABX1P8D6_9CYAN|nr:hypothetical protein [Brasilonema bromeliae]NMG19742.1 hypothetical protein [Brasilonema bromeliae SPC951]